MEEVFFRICWIWERGWGIRLLWVERRSRNGWLSLFNTGRSSKSQPRLVELKIEGPILFLCCSCWVVLGLEILNAQYISSITRLYLSSKSVLKFSLLGNLLPFNPLCSKYTSIPALTCNICFPSYQVICHRSVCLSPSFNFVYNTQ